MSCIFCAIVAGQAPASIVAESERVLAFMSIQPTAPGECLVIPKAHVDHFSDLPALLAAEVMGVAHQIAGVLRETFPMQRVGYLVHGYGVVHAHMILIPQQGPYHLTSDRFARIDEGRVVFDLSSIAIAERTTLDAHAEQLRGALSKK